MNVHIMNSHFLKAMQLYVDYGLQFDAYKITSSDFNYKYKHMENELYYYWQ